MLSPSARRPSRPAHDVTQAFGRRFFAKLLTACSPVTRRQTISSRSSPTCRRMRSFASQREQLGVPDAPSSQAPLQPFRSLSFGLVASHLSGHGFPVHWTPPWIDYRPATCRRPDQVFCIFRCSNASGAPATIPIAELLACCESAALRNAFAVGKVSPVTCPRTTDFHSAQAIAEDLGTFAPWVFAFFGSKFRRF